MDLVKGSEIEDIVPVIAPIECIKRAYVTTCSGYESDPSLLPAPPIIPRGNFQRNPRTVEFDELLADPRAMCISPRSTQSATSSSYTLASSPTL